ncbi:hypothetical protein O9929_19415 [Vibrio lentus]|nr:hypothetical protein [Vibrio lentus]
MRDDGDDTFVQANRLETLLAAYYKHVPCWLASAVLFVIMTSLSRRPGLALIGPDELKDLENTPNGMAFLPCSRW